ncbi:MAG: tetratricopeptide repeat protein, partial [Enterovibrio sp.]
SYAGDSYTVSPLTQDAKTLQGLISALSPQIMPSPGSNLSAGIAQAITLLNQAGFNYGDIVVISSGAAQAQVDKALELLKNKPYRVHVLAIGTEQGAPISLPDGQLLSQNGKVVLAKLNLLPLARLATATKGIVERWQPTDADVARITSVPSYAKQFNENNVKQTISERINHGVWLLPILLLLALASFRRGVILLLAVCVLQPAPKAVALPSSFGIEKPLEQAQQILTSSWQQLDKLQQNPAFSNSDQKALHAYQAGNFQDAANQFTSPAWKGAALYKAGDYQSAIEILTPLNDITSAYNLANAHAKTGDYAKAAELYRALLAKEPSHRDAKRNLALVEQALKEQQKNPPKEQQKPDAQDAKQDQQSQNEQQGAGDNNQQNEQQQGQGQGQGQGQNNSADSSADPSQDPNSAQPADQASSAASAASPQPQHGAQPNSAFGDESAQQSASAGDGEEQENARESSAMQQAQQGKQADAEKSGQDVAAGNAFADQTSAEQQNNLQRSDPVLKKLEQVPNDTAALIRAQMLLQEREKNPPSRRQAW